MPLTQSCRAGGRARMRTAPVSVSTRVCTSTNARRMCDVVDARCNCADMYALKICAHVSFRFVSDSRALTACAAWLLSRWDMLAAWALVVAIS